MKTINYLWQHHRVLLLGFSLATLVTLGFLIKFTFSVVYWSNHRDATIEPWMPIGYIARSYQVDREWLYTQSGMQMKEARRPIPVKDAAREVGISYEEMRNRLMLAIEAQRAE